LFSSGANSSRPRASWSPRNTVCSTAMKCDLPEPNEPCR
jgi:hypothetical protein